MILAGQIWLEANFLKQNCFQSDSVSGSLDSDRGDGVNLGNKSPKLCVSTPIGYLQVPLLARYLPVTIYFRVTMCHKWLFLPQQIGPDLSNFTHCSMSLSHFVQFTTCREVSFVSFKTILLHSTYPILESLTLVCTNIVPVVLLAEFLFLFLTSLFREDWWECTTRGQREAGVPLLHLISLVHIGKTSNIVNTTDPVLMSS